MKPDVEPAYHFRNGTARRRTPSRQRLGYRVHRASAYPVLPTPEPLPEREPADFVPLRVQAGDEEGLVVVDEQEVRRVVAGRPVALEGLTIAPSGTARPGSRPAIGQSPERYSTRPDESSGPETVGTGLDPVDAIVSTSSSSPETGLDGSSEQATRTTEGEDLGDKIWSLTSDSKRSTPTQASFGRARRRARPKAVPVDAGDDRKIVSLRAGSPPSASPVARSRSLDRIWPLGRDRMSVAEGRPWSRTERRPRRTATTPPVIRRRDSTDARRGHRVPGRRGRRRRRSPGRASRTRWVVFLRRLEGLRADRRARVDRGEQDRRVRPSERPGPRP